MLADVLEPHTLRMVLLPVLAGLVICGFLVLRFVQKVAVKLVLLVALAVVGLGVSDQRAGLAECTRSDQCTLFGRAIEVPGR